MRTTMTILLLATILAGGCRREVTRREETQQMRLSTEISTDQNVPLSARVASVKRRLQEDMDKAGLGRITGDLERLMAVSIRLKATAAAEGELKPGISKLGGVPDLPEGIRWPECRGVPMALLAQLRLDDVAPYDPDGRLPKSGLLYFFYEAKEQKWGFSPEDQGNWQVIYYDGDLAGLRATTPPAALPKESRFRTCRLAFAGEIRLPSWDSRDIEHLRLSEQERDAYAAFPGAEWGEENTIHRLLGHPDQIQGEMKLECQLASHGIDAGGPKGHADPRRAALESGADDWQLLLQIDSDEDNLGAMWGDLGRVYFWIRQQDLQKRDFNKVWLVLQCY